jgi:hypothetical protein
MSGSADQNLAATPSGKDVEVEWNKRDRWKSLVGQVWVEAPDAPRRAKPACPKDRDAGLGQVRNELVCWYRKYAAEQPAGDQERYERAESDATLRRGSLWAPKHSLPLSESRRRWWRVRFRAKPARLCATSRRFTGTGLVQAAKRRARGDGRFSTIHTVAFLIAGKFGIDNINPHAA